MTNHEELNCAVIGCGLMGVRHAETLIRTPGYRCIAVFDKSHELATKLGMKHDVEVAETYDAILANKDINAVVVCLPSSLHADYGILAAKAGKNVILEKPIDISIEKSEMLIEVAKKNGVFLTIISQNRFLEGSMALKKAMEQDLFGDPLLVNVSIKWHRDDAYYANNEWRGTFSGEGGGVLMNQGIHYTDMLLWCLGEVESVKSLVSTSRSIIETEDVAGILLKMRSGAIVTLCASTTAYPGFPEKLEIHGRKGSATLEQGKLTYWKQKDNAAAPEVAFDPPEPADLDSKLVPFQRQYREILESYRAGRQPLVTPQEALNVIKTILWAYREKF